MLNDKGDPAVTTGGRFFCSAEWHLQQMKSRLASSLYNWARRLSKQSRVFSASAEHVAEYFGVNRKTALSALEELAENGFFIIDRSERFKPNVYRVISHNEWAKRNPSRCVEKIAFPWDGEGDPLGRQLYAISGGRVKFWPLQMNGLRNMGFPDEQIIEHFRTFIDEASYTEKRWKYAYYDFRGYLRDLIVAKTRSSVSSRTDSARAQSNGHHRVQSNGPAESSPTDSSSRISSRKGVDESQQTIPAPRPHLVPSPFQNLTETTTKLPAQSLPGLRGPFSPEELAEQRRILRERYSAGFAKAESNGNSRQESVGVHGE